MAQELFLHQLHGELSSELLAHRGDLSPGKAAGDDAPEVAEIGIDVEGQAVAGDAPFYGDAHRGDFPLSDPHAGPGRNPLGIEAEALERANQSRLETAQIAVHVLPQPGSEIEQGIGHHLPGAVISYISSPAGAANRYFSRIEQMGFFSAPSDGKDMAMLDQEKDIGQILSLFDLHKLLLERERGEVIHLTQLFEKQSAHNLHQLFLISYPSPPQDASLRWRGGI